MLEVISGPDHRPSVHQFWPALGELLPPLTSSALPLVVFAMAMQLFVWPAPMELLPASGMAIFRTCRKRAGLSLLMWPAPRELLPFQKSCSAATGPLARPLTRTR